jgi:hypothetical protein
MGGGWPSIIPGCRIIDGRRRAIYNSTGTIDVRGMAIYNSLKLQDRWKNEPQAFLKPPLISLNKFLI